MLNSRICKTLLALSLVLVYFSPTLAAGEPEFELLPDNLALAPGETAEFTLVLRNTTEFALTDVIIEVLVDPVLIINGLPDKPMDILAGFDQAWRLSVTRQGNLPTAHSLFLHARYTTTPEGQTQLTRKLLSTALTINPQALPVADNVAEVEVKSALKSLLEQRTGLVYLVVHNKTDQTLSVQPPIPSGPEFVTFEMVPNEASELLPRDSHTYPIKVTVSDTVQPGKHMLLFDIPISRQRLTSVDSYHLVATYEVDVGVLGESEILKLLEIPSFLLLPGVLTVVTVGLWWLLTKPADQKDKFPLKARNEYFWVVAITVSIIIAGLYPLLTSWLLKTRRDYLYGYGLLDVVLAWTFGLGGGVLYIVISELFQLVRDWILSLIQRRNYPTTLDSLFDLLAKLERAGLGMTLKQFKKENDAQVYYLLQQPLDTQSEWWVSPAAEIQFSSRLSTTRMDYLYHLLTKEGELEAQIKGLNAAEAQDEITISVRPVPHKAERTELTYTGQEGSFVQFRNPNQIDDYFSTLVKMKWRGQNNKLDQVKVEGDPQEYLVLQAQDESGTNAWISPPIKYKFTSEITTEHESEILEQTAPEGDLYTLAVMLQDAVANGEVEIIQPPALRKVQHQLLKPTGNEDLFVQPG